MDSWLLGLTCRHTSLLIILKEKRSVGVRPEGQLCETLTFARCFSRLSVKIRNKSGFVKHHFVY